MLFQIINWLHLAVTGVAPLPTMAFYEEGWRAETNVLTLL